MVVDIVTGILSSFVMTPILLFFLVVLSVSSFGKAFGLRRLYVNLLLAIFEVGTQPQSTVTVCVNDD